MKKDLSKELEEQKLEETAEGQLVNGVVFMDPRMMEEVMEAKEFNFICKNETIGCSDDSNFICKTTLKKSHSQIKT